VGAHDRLTRPWQVINKLKTRPTHPLKTFRKYLIQSTLFFNVSQQLSCINHTVANAIAEGLMEFTDGFARRACLTFSFRLWKI